MVNMFRVLDLTHRSAGKRENHKNIHDQWGWPMVLMIYDQRFEEVEDEDEGEAVGGGSDGLAGFVVGFSDGEADGKAAMR
jgi:hypothetical protein